SSFSPNDALTPLSPSAPPAPPLALRRRQLPLHASSRLAKGWPPLRLAGRGQQPLTGALQLAPFAGAALQAATAPAGWPQPVVPAGGCASAHRRRPWEQLPPLAGATSLPFELALAAASHPLARGLGRGLAMAGCPSSSLPSLRK
ncbi:hypothetical protein BHE74_00047857, partial [Ensete ventricosum]